MKLIVFDVGNAACSVVSSPNKYAMMIDCGSLGEKTNPVEIYNSNKEWLGVKPFVTSKGTSYELGLLHITHPDDDHVRNAKRIKEELTPYLLRKRKYEDFPDNDTINKDYIEEIDKHYRGSDPEHIDWGFTKNITFEIPIETVISDEDLSKKIRNNASIIRFIEYNGIRILYSGDLESPGWDWLIANNQSFVDTVSGGIDVLIAPHHGHKSGFPSSLFDLTGNVKCVIHSKGSEGNIEGTDVSSQYSENANGVNYKNLNDEEYYFGKVLTTRSNGNIFFHVNGNGLDVWTSKASPNHEKVK